MASLVEELVTVLEEEEKIYQTLISYGEKKTDILIRADVPELDLYMFKTFPLVRTARNRSVPLLAILNAVMESSTLMAEVFKLVQLEPL